MTKSKASSKKKGGKTNEGDIEPLSNFQTPATGRKDPSLSGKTNGKQKSVEPEKIYMEKIKLMDGETLEISYTRIEKDATPTSVSEVHKAPVHPDLKACFKSMRIHLGINCDYISYNQV